MKLNDFLDELLEDPEYRKYHEQHLFQSELASSIIEGRIKKGYSQSKLAELVGSKQANISKIESGIGNPTANLISRILFVLDIHLVFINPLMGNSTEFTLYSDTSDSTSVLNQETTVVEKSYSSGQSKVFQPC